MGKEVRDDLKYTKSHEWVRVKDDIAVVGITDYAQGELTDIVYVDLPEVGKKFKKGEEICTLESIKSVAEVYAPITGKVIRVNETLKNSPEKINESPYDEGWLVEMEIENKNELDELLSPEDYRKIIS